MDNQTPSLGRTVHYTLTAEQADDVNRRRAAWQDRQFAYRGHGLQAHVGNPAHEGDVLAMVIVRVIEGGPGNPVNGKVQLDGTDELWVTGVQEGAGPGHWFWPPRQ